METAEALQRSNIADRRLQALVRQLRVTAGYP
jgi:hypothetical protein